MGMRYSCRRLVPGSFPARNQGCGRLCGAATVVLRFVSPALVSRQEPPCDSCCGRRVMTRRGSSATQFSLRAAAATGALVLVGSVGGATASAQDVEGTGRAAATSPFPVPVKVGNARQVVTVKATGS